ncbi:MAG: TIM barrel protein [Acidobacteria bacterium]|nr:TIM barrel protein [Acidobacteriota bacterium]
MKLTRRSLLASAAVGTATLAAAAAPAPAQPVAGWGVCAFSKHFQWLPVADAAALTAEIGYDALDLTVRPGGHVEPARVADDLPKAVEAIRKAGLTAPMFTSGIVDVRTPHAEAVLKTAAALGIRRYRWGGFSYDASKPIPRQIEEFRASAKELAALNKAHGLCAMYHTHSGVGQFGASFWDIGAVLQGLDNDLVSVNLDCAHATIEGGLGGWINSTRLLAPMTRGIAIKDFHWAKNSKGKWAVRWCPMREGMVNSVEFLKLLKAAGFHGPIQLHMEYDELGGADSGKSTIKISRAEFTRMAKQDVARLREDLAAAGY